MHHRSRFLFLFLSLVAIVAACSSGGGAASPSVAAPSVAAPSVAPSELAPSEPAPSVATGGLELKVAESSLGQIIVDGAGLDASKLTTVDRTDGGKQLKYGTWTLYYFASDAAAGDVKGQGQNEVWYVIAPSGDLIKG